MKRAQIGLVKARYQFFDNSSSQKTRLMEERASRERKRIELEQSIGQRANIFGKVLEDKELMYSNTISEARLEYSSLGLNKRLR